MFRIAVAISGVAQFIWLLEACRQNGSIPKLRRPRVTSELKSCLSYVTCSFRGRCCTDKPINRYNSSINPAFGSISFLYFADRINQLPYLDWHSYWHCTSSKIISRNSMRRARKSKKAKITPEFGMVLALPAAVGLLVLSQPIISTLFERGAFSSTAVDATAQTLFCYALGLPAFIIIKVLQPSFLRVMTLSPQ